MGDKDRQADADTRLPRPHALRVIPDGIPAEMTARDQWVVWLYEWRLDKAGKGTWTKPPSDPRTAKHADSTDPKTWVSFNDALAAYSLGGWDGIGRIHLPEDRITVLDLDKVRDPATGAVEPKAARIVAEIDSYTEISPSGAGLRIVARGRKPDRQRSRRKVFEKGDLEMYDGLTADGKPGGRFLTFTGHRLDGAPATVNDRQEQINAVYRRELLQDGAEAGAASRNGPAANGNASGRSRPFKGKATRSLPDPGEATDKDVVRYAEEGADALLKTLWAGEWSGYYPSQSEADLALCDKLAW
jgi:primase-polymerase (primpol)-like protein